jgi:hypothetical protein
LRDFGTICLVYRIDEERGSAALARPPRHLGQPPGGLAVVMERALTVDKYEIEVGGCKLLPVPR